MLDLQREGAIVISPCVHHGALAVGPFVCCDHAPLVRGHIDFLRALVLLCFSHLSPFSQLQESIIDHYRRRYQEMQQFQDPFKQKRQQGLFIMTYRLLNIYIYIFLFEYFLTFPANYNAAH